MLHFHCVWLFCLLPLPWLMQHVLASAKPMAQAALRIPFFSRMRALGGVVTHGTNTIPTWQRVCAYGIWFLLVIAAAGPQWLGKPQLLQQEGRNIMLAIDLSGSMQIPDMDLNHERVNRLQMVKAVAS